MLKKSVSILMVSLSVLAITGCAKNRKQQPESNLKQFEPAQPVAVAPAATTTRQAPYSK